MQRQTSSSSPPPGAASDLRQGRYSAEALVLACQARIDCFNPELNALITLNREGALLAAREADRRLAQGEPLPPLLGVPVSIKDAFATRDMRTTSSFRPLADYRPRGRCLGGGPLAAGRRDPDGQEQSARTGGRAPLLEPAVRAHAQPMESGPYPGGQLGRQRRGHRGRLLAAGDRQRHWRLDPHPGGLLRRCGA
jgi:amidase